MGGGGRFAYVEHTAEDVHVVDGQVISADVDLLSRDSWAAGNPAYGSRITDEALQTMYDELGPELFARECLCIWDPDPEAGAASMIDPAAWAAKSDADARASGAVVMGFAVAHDGSWSSVGVSDGTHVETIYNARGTSWLPAKLDEFNKRNKPSEIVCVARGPVNAVLADVEAVVDVRKLSGDEWNQASMTFAEVVRDRRITHLGQPELDRCMSVHPKKSGDAWHFDRDGLDISPLEAVAAARFAAVGAAPVTPVAVFV